MTALCVFFFFFLFFFFFFFVSCFVLFVFVMFCLVGPGRIRPGIVISNTNVHISAVSSIGLIVYYRVKADIHKNVKVIST